MEKIVMAFILIILSIFDGRGCKVPIIVIGGEFLLVFVCMMGRCMRNSGEWNWIVLAAFLGMLPGMFVLGIAYFTKKIGLGDGLVLTGLGVLAGYQECLALICFSLLIMSVWCIGVICSKKGNRNTKIPYLPFLTAVYMTRLIV